VCETPDGYPPTRVMNCMSLDHQERQGRGLSEAPQEARQILIDGLHRLDAQPNAGGSPTLVGVRIASKLCGTSKLALGLLSARFEVDLTNPKSVQVTHSRSGDRQRLQDKTATSWRMCQLAVEEPCSTSTTPVGTPHVPDPLAWIVCDGFRRSKFHHYIESKVSRVSVNTAPATSTQESGGQVRSFNCGGNPERSPARTPPQSR
jgi:hypothetical protein